MILRRLAVFILSEARDWLFAVSAFAGVAVCIWLTGGEWLPSILVLAAFIAAYLCAVFLSERILERIGKGEPSDQ